MREITLTDTHGPGGSGEGTPNPPVVVYDTSGPYTDPDVEIDVHQGLPSVRGEWIRARGDVEEVQGSTSDYGRFRAAVFKNLQTEIFTSIKEIKAKL